MTQAVFFDVLPKSGFVDAYFAMATGLRSIVEKNPGFISVERFKNLQKEGWYLSFSNWSSQDSLASWRCQPDHSSAQVCGRSLILEDYRLRVGSQIKAIKTESKGGNVDLIVAFVGNLNEIKHAIDKIQATLKPRLFQGVLDPARGIAMVEISAGESINFPESDLYDVRYFEVVRDYGMFNREQAPQQFI